MTKKEFKERAQLLTANHANIQFDKRLQVSPPTSFRKCSFENDRIFYLQLGELACDYLRENQTADKVCESESECTVSSTTPPKIKFYDERNIISSAEISYQQKIADLTAALEYVRKRIGFTHDLQVVIDVALEGTR